MNKDIKKDDVNAPLSIFKREKSFRVKNLKIFWPDHHDIDATSTKITIYTDIFR